MVNGTSRMGACSARAISGSDGRYMSIDSGPSAVKNDSNSVRANVPGVSMAMNLALAKTNAGGELRRLRRMIFEVGSRPAQRWALPRRRTPTLLGQLDLRINMLAQLAEPRHRPRFQLRALLGQVDGHVFHDHRRRMRHHQHALAEIDRFVDIMGDEQHGDAQPVPQHPDKVLEI